jgi:molybdenum cofactor cytidylyltransferase
MIAPIVLAAGESTRMGSPKALLPDREGRPFVARIVRTCAGAGFDEVTVVTGTLHEPIVAAVAADRPPIAVRFARNPDPSRGQLSSIWTGLDSAVRPGVSAIMITLVDVPLVSSATMRAVADAYRRTHAAIVRPALDDRHGHPVVFDEALFDALRRADPAAGAKSVLRAHAAEIVHVAVDDPGSVEDVDTPEEYERMLRS